MRTPSLRSAGHAAPAPPGAAGRKGHRQTRALPSSPATRVQDRVQVRNGGRRGFAKRPPRASPKRALPGTKARASPGLSHPDSRCTPSASTPACRASIVKFRSRPVSSGFQPSLTLTLGPTLGDGDVEGTRRWPPQDPGVMWREGCYFPDGLRARLVLPSSPSGQTGQGSGSRGGGALGHSRRASSAAPRGLSAPPRPP